jgi:hypothetical protein
MTHMPTQPSMIEAWSLNDLRCKVYEGEAQRIKDLEWDRPDLSAAAGRPKGFISGGRGTNRRRIRWPVAAIGALVAASGALWLLTILGFEFPWYSAEPVGLMVIGSFISASALNLRTGCARTSDDRCDH